MVADFVVFMFVVLLLLLAVCFGMLVLLLLVYINSVGMFGSYCRQ